MNFCTTETSCDDGKEGAGDDAPELGMDNVGGVFLVLAGGLGISIFIGILEFLWNVSKVSAAEKVRLRMRCVESLIEKLFF